MRKTGRANRCTTYCKLTPNTIGGHLEQEFSNFIFCCFFPESSFLKKLKEIDGPSTFNSDYKHYSS